MTLEQPLVASPVERLPARAPVQPRVPEPSNEPIESLETAIVRRSPVVLVVAPEFGIERRGLMLDRVVPMLLALTPLIVVGPLLAVVLKTTSTQ